MPLDYSIDKRRRLVVSTGSGIVTAEESRSHQQRLLADPEFDPSFNQLIDFTAATELRATAAELAPLARRSVFSPGSKRAWVASAPAIFGMGRLAATYHELSDTPSQVQVFSDMPTALDWLGLGKTSAD